MRTTTKQKSFLLRAAATLLLLCAVVQGAKAQDFDVWDGHSETKPEFTYNQDENRYIWGINLEINTAAELAWVMNHYDEAVFSFNYGGFWTRKWLTEPAYKCNININANIDMTAGEWIPLGKKNKIEYGRLVSDGCTFNGKGHTIRIKIDNESDDNYQGLFYEINNRSSVKNLHLDGKIKVDNARLVGGIVAENYGTIENCFVSADVESNHYSAYDADLGGVAGMNYGKIKYCCVTGNVTNTDKNSGVGGIAGSNEGTIEHVTFYGSVSVEHSQDNKWVGDQDATLTNNHDEFSQAEHDDAKAQGMDFYADAIRYPFAISVNTSGDGSVTADADRAYPGQTVTLTVTPGSQDVAGATVNIWQTLSGNQADGYAFTMPRADANVKVVFCNADGTVPDINAYNGLEDGKTYRVTENVTINNRRLFVSGTATLILGEGATLTIPKGIELSADYNANLTIEGPGRLVIDGCDTEKSGIGAERVGTLTINGGTIDVTGGVGAAGIGGDYDNTVGGTITINGGVVTARAGSSSTSVEDGGAGIGGGGTDYAKGTMSGDGEREKGVCGDIVINGGQVTAIGRPRGTEYGPGIGPGYESIGTGIGKAYDSGTLTLGWTSPSDFLCCSGFKTDGSDSPLGKQSSTLKSITLVRGKNFRIGENTSIATVYDIKSIENQTIRPHFTLSGEGTKHDPYIISSPDNWNDFVSYVNNGDRFSDKVVMLTSNISVSTLAGTDDADSFQGTFDGNGQTLTFNKGTAQSPFDETYCAPFRHVKNAVIKNLHVAGTIYTSAMKAAGFVGESHGALTLTGCRSSVAINSSKGGDGTHGGFVATLSGRGNAITFDGCVFDGSLTTTAGTVGCGGFVGWGVYNKPVIKNSLLKPGSVSANMLGSNFARWYTGDEGIYKPTITNCYYIATDNLPTDQGMEPVIFDSTPDNLGEQVADYDMLTAYANGLLYGGKYYMAFVHLSLADAADNSTAIGDANGYLADVTLAGRTLYKDGQWNTLCLPFDVRVAEDSPLVGAEVKTLTGSQFANGTLTMNFSETSETTLTAGVPYIIRWSRPDEYVAYDGTNAAGCSDLVNPVFTGVTVSSAAAATALSGFPVETDYVDFVGTYSPTVIYEEGTEQTNLYLGSGNTLCYPTDDDFTVNAFRGYFVLKDGLTAGETSEPQQTGVRTFVLNFGDSSGASDIVSLSADSEDSADSGAWYTLSGMRLEGEPTAPGIYVKDGRKVVLK